MTQVEAEAVMETAKHAEVVPVHADQSNPTGRAPFKKNKGKGGGKGGGKGTSRILLSCKHW